MTITDQMIERRSRKETILRFWLGSVVVLVLFLKLFCDLISLRRIIIPGNEVGNWTDSNLNLNATNGNTTITLKTTTKLTTKIIQENEIDWSDSIFEPGGYGKPIVIESHKLVFFTIPKNACSVFKKLFRRMMGYNDWLEKMPHASSDSDGLKHLGNFSRDEQLTMMTSPEWTRAVFVRDPLERTLSAYLDKGLSKRGKFVKEHCCDINEETTTIPTADKPDFCREIPFFPFDFKIKSTNFPFQSFVDKVLVECRGGRGGHWAPQHELLKMANWDLINFVGKLENGMADTHFMLKQIGAFEEFGASGWGEFRNESIFQSNNARHKTGSMSAMEQYYTPELQKDVYQHVRGDYELKLFNFSIPSDLENL